jgi:hypothetical protein
MWKTLEVALQSVDESEAMYSVNSVTAKRSADLNTYVLYTYLTIVVHYVCVIELLQRRTGENSHGL